MVPAQKTLYEEFAEFITSNPPLEQLANYQLSEASEARIDYLLEASRDGTLTPDERNEVDNYLRLEHLMRLIKIYAHDKA